MKSFAFLELLLGVSLLCGCGCKQIADIIDPDRANVAGQTRVVTEAPYLKKVAAELGVSSSSERLPVELASDIKLKIDDESVSVPEPLDQAISEKLKRLMKPEDIRRFERAQQFLKDHHGQRVYPLPEKK